MREKPRPSFVRKSLMAGGLAAAFLVSPHLDDDTPKHRTTTELKHQDTNKKDVSPVRNKEGGLGWFVEGIESADASRIVGQQLQPPDLTKKLSDPHNADTLTCIIQNVHHEGRGEIDVGGDMPIAAVTLARALDPKKRFLGTRKDGLPKILGDVCRAVQRDNAFAWTRPDSGVIQRQTNIGEVRDVHAIRKHLLPIIGDVPPRQALQRLLQESGFDFVPLYYHAPMWGTFLGADGTQYTYGTKPTRKEGESKQKYRERLHTTMMSHNTAKMFYMLRQQALKTGAYKKVGSHTFYGDSLFTMTDIAKPDSAELAQK